MKLSSRNNQLLDAPLDACIVWLGTAFIFNDGAILVA
jgi:hypothetical protein